MSEHRELLFGPYQAPLVKLGQIVEDEIRGEAASMNPAECSSQVGTPFTFFRRISMPQTQCTHEWNHLMRHSLIRIGCLRISWACIFLAILVLAGATHAGDMEIEKLKQGLQSPNEAVRVNAIKKFKSSAAEAGKAAEVLVPLLADMSSPVQQAASAALVKLGKEAVPALALGIQSKDWSARRAAGLALTKAGTHAVPALIEAVEKGPLLSSRAEAILALGTIGQGAKAAINPLIEVLRDPNNSHLHKQALTALS